MVSVLDSSLPAASVPSVKSGERGYYSISEAAALLGVSRVSIWRWIRAGHLTASRLGHRTTRIKRDDLERILVQIGSAGSSSSIIRKPGSGESVADGALPARIARSTP